MMNEKQKVEAQNEWLRNTIGKTSTPRLRIVRADTRNWVVEKFVPAGLHPITKQLGKDRWEVIGYFGKLEDVANFLVNYLADADEADDLIESVNNLLAALAVTKAKVVKILQESLQ